MWLWEMWARRGLVALCRVPRQHTATVIMAKQVTSGQKLAHALVQAQDADPRAATLPNMCSSHTIMLKDNANTLFRCFSVSLRRPHDLPPDRWEIVELPDAMPDPPSHCLKKGCTVDARRVVVDHITFGLLADHRLQAAVGPKGELVAMRMFPPAADTEKDASEYWSQFADRLKAAAPDKKPLIEE